jgi:UDP-N-acetylglucosamine--N-acetylmuramyl-(pentapeptide) pyrophosphoryl-undecaprenol N-acetylglucosamine transferase
LLILGGSAGAADLDRAMRDALPHLRPLTQRLSVVHQASPSEVAALRDQYRAAGIDAVVESFFADMAGCYQRASLVVTRAGAATLGELAAVGRPAVLVPLPAAGDHQLANARAWAEAGCARLILPRTLDGATLAAAIVSLAQDRSSLARMGAAARARHRPDAALRMAEWCRHAVRSR